MTKENRGSRTIRATLAEWAEITKAAIEMGFGANGRSNAIIKLARDHNERADKKARRDK